jgi:hypothetical protein
MVYFLDDISPSTLAMKAVIAHSTLIAFFEYNVTYKDNWNYLYVKFLAYFI